MKVLIIEDDKETREYLCQSLKQQGWEVDQADNGQDGLFLALEGEYQVIILDRMLPALDGLTVLSTLRAAKNAARVLILSALDSVDERVKGLKHGGDDYLTKPFALAELIARVEILASRSATTAPQGVQSQLNNGHIQLDLLSQEVFVASKKINVQAKEFKLLRYLIEHAGQVITRSLLFEAVWDYNFDPQTNVIDVHIARLRKKLESEGNPNLIETVRGAGYRMVKIK
ncbi:DNA-binding response regulator [Vibrio sp. UCD-FRSSP16_10]|uniref:response regulator transcription factor n=1 Tax=unclassified Vibrio TaxID=2614977 RepID=UPI000800E196|nr:MULTISPECIES: response regulator transcription factor [unclassified Vibrio]OBT13987.1 DNA-binding response regulator [Vibrio sp. UCD-FRSSP16_30]OBT22868.1 DNA-binding response regulator [Vibrio sp. UCD-FRSSP16_10]